MIKNNKTIYAICDYNNLIKHNISIEDFVKICKKLNVKIIQYRDKHSSNTKILQNLILLRKLWNKTLIINDKIEFVNFCDGLHLGQEDLKLFASNKQVAIKRIRKKIGNAILGITTHNITQIKEANTLLIDYIGLGAYKSSLTKNVSFILGKRVSTLAKYSLHKVAVIGGVKLTDKIKNVDYLAISSDIIKRG